MDAYVAAGSAEGVYVHESIAGEWIGGAGTRGVE